jgi:hypothetical protein
LKIAEMDTLNNTAFFHEKHSNPSLVSVSSALLNNAANNPNLVDPHTRQPAN